MLKPPLLSCPGLSNVTLGGAIQWVMLGFDGLCVLCFCSLACGSVCGGLVVLGDSKVFFCGSCSGFVILRGSAGRYLDFRFLRGFCKLFFVASVGVW